jgi:hypothetical protein
LSSNIVLRFEDIEHKETCLLDLSGQKWEVYKMPSILISEEGFIALTLYCIHNHASRIDLANADVAYPPCLIGPLYQAVASASFKLCKLRLTPAPYRSTNCVPAVPLLYFQLLDYGSARRAGENHQKYPLKTGPIWFQRQRT